MHNTLKNTGVRCCWLLLVLMAAGRIVMADDTLAAGLPQPHLMPGMKGSWIAERMTMNGVPMSILEFRGRAPREYVIEYYESRWRDGGDAIRRQDGEWTIVLTKRDGYVHSVRARAYGRGSEATYTVSADPQEYEPSFDTTFPLPGSATVLYHHRYLDKGIEAESITLHSPRSVASEAEALRGQLAYDRWRPIIDRPGEKSPDGHFMQYQKGRGHAQIFLGRNPERSGGTLILITWRKS